MSLSIKDAMDDKRQISEKSLSPKRANTGGFEDFVLEKHIFSNVFEKDIRRVFVYKKAERLAKAIHLIAPAFAGAPTLRNRAEQVAIAIIDASVLPPLDARVVLSRELLALSSVLSIARSSGMLSAMNADLISREAHHLLQEVAAYEEPRLFLEELPSFAELSKTVNTGSARETVTVKRTPLPLERRNKEAGSSQGHIKGQVLSDTLKSPRREAILSVLGTKGPSYIKDISTIVRDVSEKTIQRELAALVGEGLVLRQGERRWTIYRLPEATGTV